MHASLRSAHPTLLAALLVVVAATLSTSCSRSSRVARTLDLANRHYAAGDLDRAEIEYKNVLDKDPQNAGASLRLGLLYHDQGRYSRAAAYLLRARELEPDNLEVRIKLSLAHLAGGAAREARDEAAFVLDRQPTDPQAPLLLVESSLATSELQDARQRLAAVPEPAAQTAPVLVALGQIALRQNRVDDARTAFQQALARDPKCAAAHAAVGVLAWAEKNLTAAAEEFRLAAELSPLRSPKRLQYAQFNLRTGNGPAARQFLEDLCRQAPDYVPARVWLAETAMGENKSDEADSHVAKALSREPLDADALLLHARIRLAKGESAQAVTELEKMAMLFPRSPQVAYHLGIAYSMTGDVNKALLRLQQVTLAAPELLQAHVTLAELQVRKRDYSSAISVLKPLVRDHAAIHGARVLLAEAYRGQGSLDEAAMLYSGLTKERPNDAALAFGHGAVLVAQRKLAEARAEFQRAAQLEPGNIAAVEQLVELDLRGKDPASARQRVEAALGKTPNSGPLHLLSAKVCTAEGNPAGTEAALKKAIEAQPNFLAAHYALAQLYVQANDQDKAIASLQESTKQNPQGLVSFLLLGVLLEQRQDHAGARTAYEKAIALDPKSALALNNLACLCTERFNEPEQAVAFAQRARAVLPNEPRVADTLAWALVQNRQYASALGLLQDCALKLPTVAEVQYHLGIAHYMMGNVPSAEAALQSALDVNSNFAGAADARARLGFLRLDPAKDGTALRTDADQRLKGAPNDGSAHLRLAQLARASDKPDEALLHYRAVLQHYPANAAALIGLARYHADRREWPKALEVAKDARNAAPDDSSTTRAVARLAYDGGEYKWAASLLQDIARAQPTDPNVLADWAEAACAVGRLGDAEAAARRALEISSTFPARPKAELLVEMLSLCSNPLPAQRPKIERVLQAQPTNAAALLALGRLAAQQSDRATARTMYERVLQHYPDCSPAQRDLTILYASGADQPPNAAQLATRARQAFPDDSELLRAAGIVAYRHNEFSKAVALLRDCVSRNRSDGEALYYLGMAQSRLNQRAASKESLQRALELGLKDQQASEATKTLARAD